MQEKIAQLKADLFKAISHPTRIRILELLSDGEHCVCDIFEQLNVEQANTSQHLSVMKKQGILQSRKEGLRVIYSIKHPEIIELIEFANKILKKQASEVMSTFGVVAKK
ncbi:regulatory protein ArsR [Desulfotomaculum nigrificans CO-1-SRB]|uniref:Regulatory protein ArsR n=1 Tax=Desulfotomaculum nigrificans (strain DSM 14880 / VKM B-2319 / CO-1-SRB) TaxID=868595 RepID=F6B2Q3_DESCC|nr:metalloregulator ArsR/SmtB family transcription factor [Desulfotomaculum nigrificans]AEF93882.1 regulatory protein ArsR [Desulfotomaculum nigrificans CO-1-SRB]